MELNELLRTVDRLRAAQRWARFWEVNMQPVRAAGCRARAGRIAEHLRGWRA